MLDIIPGPDSLAPNEATQEPVRNDDADFLRTATERLRYGLEADRENREADIDDRKFRAGEQWPEEVKQQRVNRPCLTINRTGQFVRQVTGDIRLNKPAIKISPAEGGNPQTAEVIEGLVRNIERASKAQRVYVDAAEDAATGGMGCACGGGCSAGGVATAAKALKPDIRVIAPWREWELGRSWETRSKLTPSSGLMPCFKKASICGIN